MSGWLANEKTSAIIRCLYCRQKRKKFVPRHRKKAERATGGAERDEEGVRPSGKTVSE